MVKIKKLDNINMKKIIKLTESDLHRLVKETVKKILSEDKNSEMESDYEKYGAGYGKPKYFQGISDDEWNKQTKDDYEKEFDKFEDEYLNTPNASKDFKSFPRMSVVRNHDYDPLSNGTAKRKREDKLANLKSERTSLIDIEKVKSYDKMEDEERTGYIFKFKDGNGEIEDAVLSIYNSNFEENTVIFSLYKGLVSSNDLNIVKSKVEKLKAKYESKNIKVIFKMYEEYPSWYYEGSYHKV